MTIWFLGKEQDEASSRYRIQPVMAELTARGHTTEFVSTEMGFVQKFAFLQKLDAEDLVFIQRKLFANWFLHLMKRRVRHLVFDFDDAIFVKSTGQASRQRGRKFEAICQQASLILAGNRFLAESTGQPEHTRLVPTGVDMARYQAPTDVPGEAAAQEGLTLVWIGSSSTRRYLDMLTPVLDQLATRLPGARLKVIADFDLHLESLPVQNVRWSEGTEVRELQVSDIGIAPMVNNAWTRGKCALKVIQYMAAGLPVVSDRCGANQEVILEGQTGYLADNEQDWIEAIQALAASADQRREMGSAGRQRAYEHYDLKRIASQTADALESLQLG